MVLSIEKTNFIIFHNKQNSSKELFERLKLGNVYINRVKITKYMGLNIDQHLNWEYHVEEVQRNLMKYFNIFYNIRGMVPPKLKKQIYNAFVLSRVSYGLEVYGSCSVKLNKQLQTLQNKLLKVLFYKDRLTNTQELHKDLNFLLIKDQHKVNILNFVFNILNNDPIEALKNYYCLGHQNHNYAVRNRYDVHVAMHKTKLGSTTLSLGLLSGIVSL